MAYLEWEPDLDTGIEIIDSQHRRIVDYINQLHEAKIADDRTMVGDVIDGLIDYTSSHFSFEEAMITEAGYAFVTAHQQTHKSFINRIAQFRVRFKAGQDAQTIAEEMGGMLGHWLYNHIRRDDAAYVAAVEDNINQLAKQKQEGGWLSRTLKRFFS